MAVRFLLFPLSRWLVALAVIAIGPSAAFAQTAEVRYTRAQAREETLRSAANPTAASLRALATAYEQIPRRFPRSGYSDNALWQAAGVLQLAYEHGGMAKDREKAAQLLAWLRKEYPTSPYAKQVPARLAALKSASTRPVGGTTKPKPESAPAPGISPSIANASKPSSSTPVAAPAPRVAAASTPAAVTSRPMTRLEPPPLPAAKASLPPLADSSATLPAVAAEPASVLVRSIAYTKLPKGDRLTIELSDEAGFTAKLPSPAALELTLANVGVSGPVIRAASTMRGRFVNGVMMDRGPGVLGVNVRLSGRPRYSTFPLYDPYRLVIDLEEDTPPAHTPAMAAVNPAPPPASTPPSSPAPIDSSTASKPETPAMSSRGEYSLARQLGLGVSRIVIDPGHGGHDPGAEANSIAESELVLDVALRLEKLLRQQPGFEVVLTRRTDQYISLEERTALANRENADLFLSIHANSSPNKETRGIETYFLNFATNAAAEAVAARENAASGQAMHILPDLLKVIATNDKVAESRELATMVQTSLMRRVGSLNRSIKDLGVKQAPFVVLIGAKMPSILTEISFLSNKTEAGLLQQASHRERIAQALLDGILKYQSSLKKVTAVAERQ
jgi:N-acetylmuramoyl-L-alanine amidase